MARIPLNFTGWFYDDTTKNVIGQFLDAPALDHADPASHVSTMTLEVVFKPLSEARGQAPGRPTPTS